METQSANLQPREKSFGELAKCSESYTADHPAPFVISNYGIDYVQ